MQTRHQTRKGAFAAARRQGRELTLILAQTGENGQESMPEPCFWLLTGWEREAIALAGLYPGLIRPGEAVIYDGPGKHAHGLEATK